jgi:hypothetical protein
MNVYTDFEAPLRLLLDQLFKGSVYERKPLLSDPEQIRKWWEERRLFYNKLVGGAGVVTCVLMISCGVISEPIAGDAIGLPDPPILVPFGIIAYGIAANICYTGGWIVESWLTQKGTKDTNEFGVRAFSGGMKFSVGLTLFPAIFCWAVFLVSLATGRGPLGFPR